MVNLIINFLKKSYKILVVILAAILFFLGYNTYLIDRSLVNLRFALDRISDVKTLEDAKELASILDYSLFTEVSSSDLKTSKISRIELVKDILTNPKSTSQLEVAKYTLKNLIESKEKERPPMLVILDKIFALRAAKVAKGKLENQVKYLKEKLVTLKDKDELQEVYFELANIYTQLLEFDKAKETYRTVIELDPEAKLAKRSQFNLAWNEKLQGNLDEAIKMFENLSQTAGEEKLITFSKYQMAEIYKKKGDYLKAVAIYQEIAGQQYDEDLSNMAWLQTGYTYLYDLKEYEKTKEIFDRTKELLKGTEVARQIEKIALPEVLIQYREAGFKLLKEGYEKSLPEKYKEATKFFDKALEIDAKDGLSYIGKALAFLWLNDPDRALGFAKRAVKLLPQDEVASVNLGYIYIQLGIVDEAIIEYKRFISVNPFTVYGYYNLGYAYTIQNRLEDAIYAFTQATKINPKFILAYNNLGWCHWQLNQYNQAIEAFEKALGVNPNFLDALFNISTVYKLIGKYEDAKKRFEKILKIDPTHIEAQKQLKEIENILQSK